MDASCRFVSGHDNAAILYRDYKMLCLISRVKRNKLFEQYKQQIELDIVRTYPRSRWLQDENTQAVIRQQLKVWCIYSSIGYFQGLLFLLVPLCHYFQGLDHISFFAFVRMVKNLYFVHKDVIHPVESHKETKEAMHVLRVLSHCIQLNEDQMHLRQLVWVIEFNIMFTLALNRCGNLSNTDLIINFFISALHNKKKFIQRVKTFAFAFLLHILKSDMSPFDISIIEFDRNAIASIIHCASSSGTLFKAFA